MCLSPVNHQRRTIRGEERKRGRTQSIILTHPINLVQEDLKLDPRVRSKGLVHRDGQLANHVVEGRLSVEDEDDGSELVELEVPRFRIESSTRQVPDVYRDEGAVSRVSQTRDGGREGGGRT